MSTGLNIAGELNIQSAGGVHRTLVEALAGGDQADECRVDLSGVDACDAIGLQLILSARKSARRMNRPFTVTAMSPVVAEAAAAIGLSPEELS